MKKIVFSGCTTLLVLLFSTQVCSQQSLYKEVLFLGMFEESSPAQSKTFDRMLRSRLSTAFGISITDYEQTLRYRNYIDFSRYPTISLGRLFKLQQILPDSLVLLWGRIVENEIKPKRHTIIGSQLHAQLSINLTIYNPTKKTYIFNGVISKQKKYPGPPIFFGSPDKLVLIEASLRSKILEDLLEQVTTKSASMLTSLLKNNDKIEAAEEQAQEEEKGAPSISDVFSIPSVAPQTILDNDNSTNGSKR